MRGVWNPSSVFENLEPALSILRLPLSVLFTRKVTEWEYREAKHLGDYSAQKLYVSDLKVAYRLTDYYE